MAKKTEPESFTEMFSQFGHRLNMPDVDVDAIIDHNRKNLEALEKSAKASVAGASALMNKQREMLQETLRDFTDMAQSFRTPGNAQELIGRQTDFARKTFEAALRNAGEVAEVMKKSGTESVEILRERIRESMEEIREGYEKKKK